MEKTFILFLGILQIVIGQSRIEKHTISSEILGIDKNFNIYLPEGYNSAIDSMSVVYLFRGHEDEFLKPEWDYHGRTIKTVADQLYENKNLGKIILVMPGFSSATIPSQGPLEAEGVPINHIRPDLSQNISGLGSGKMGDYFFEELVPYIENNFKVKKGNKSRALDGFSLGAYSSFLLAIKYPDFMVSAGGYDASLMWKDLDSPQVDGEFDDWLWFLDYPGLHPVFDWPRDTSYILENSPIQLLLDASDEKLDSIKQIVFLNHASYSLDDASASNRSRNEQFMNELADRGIDNAFDMVALQDDAIHNQTYAINHFLLSLPIHWSILNNLPFLKSPKINKYVFSPTIDTIFTSIQLNNIHDGTNFSPYVLTRSIDSHEKDSTLLYDDGAHFDGDLNDNRFGGYFTIDEEGTFDISYSVKAHDYGTHHNISNSFRITTKGPVTIDHIEYSTQDTIPNPNDQLRFKMYFKNNGSVAAIKNIKITMAQINACVRPTNLSYRTIDVLEAGEIKETNGESGVKIENDCGESGSYGVKLTISEGDYSYWSDTLYFEVVSDSAESEPEPEPELPETFAIYQNYPNPFNPVTTIRYDLKNKSNVQLTIYDLAGRAIKTLVNQSQNAGSHAVEFDASGLSSGIYVYRIKTSAGFVASRKMVVLK